METTVQDSGEPQTGRKGLRLFIGQLSWRMILMRLVINGLTLILVAILVPDIYFVDRTFLSIVLMAVMLGVLNAFVKPIVQFLTLPFIFATYGFVVVLINTIILLLLAFIFEERFYVGRLIWAIVGGLVMGVVSSFLESLLGLNLPIVPKSALPEGEGSVRQPGSRIINSMLTEDEETASDESISETAKTVDSAMTAASASPEQDNRISEPASEESSNEAQTDLDAEQQGEER